MQASHVVEAAKKAPVKTAKKAAAKATKQVKKAASKAKSGGSGAAFWYGPDRPGFLGELVLGHAQNAKGASIHFRHLILVGNMSDSQPLH